jgi:hypothetical protein
MDQSNALKDHYGRTDVLELVRGIDQIVAARGPKVVEFDMVGSPPDEATLNKHLLGPSGNLRAPAIRRGKRLFIGFHADAMEKFLAVRSERP